MKRPSYQHGYRLDICWLVYLRVQQLNSLADIQQFLLRQLATSLGLLHQRPQLVELRLQQVVASLHNRDVLLKIVIGTKRIVQLQL